MYNMYNMYYMYNMYDMYNMYNMYNMWTNPAYLPNQKWLWKLWFPQPFLGLDFSVWRCISNGVPVYLDSGHDGEGPKLWS